MDDLRDAWDLPDTFMWRDRAVRWRRLSDEGPPLVFCHGTPWSSWLWAPFANALAGYWSVHVWDMPGYGQSGMADGDVSLGAQGEVFSALLSHWALERPHVVAHDIGGTVALRAHLLHGMEYGSLALVDVVALAPWGSPFYRLVRDHADAFMALPAPMHAALVRAYIAGASATQLPADALDALVAPWLGRVGQAAFYRQIAQSTQLHTDQIEPRYGDVSAPTLVVWGSEDTWIPVDRASRLADAIPHAQLEIIGGAGHLVQLDQPARLAMTLQRWLDGQRRVL